MTAWQNAAATYSNAVAELAKKIGVVSKVEYDKLTKAAEIARKDALAAQATLEAHTAEHGCGDSEVGA